MAKKKPSRQVLKVIRFPEPLRERLGECAEHETETLSGVVCLLLREGIRARYGITLAADGSVENAG